MSKITKEEIWHYLSNPSSNDELQKQALNIRKKMADLDSERSKIEREIVETVQISVHYESGSGSSSGEKKDLSHILEITKHMLEGQREELYMQYQSILEQMEKIHRLWLVYDTLSEQTREVLNRLSKNETWEWIEHDMGISHRKLINIRRQALDDIQNRFNSDLTNLQLVRQRNTSFIHNNRKQHRQKKKYEEHITGQLTLETMNHT